MSRKPPSNISVPEVKKSTDPSMIIQVRRYKVVTPLFGGGVKPSEADPVTVVRATEVRGHLRFWWRATRGWACSSLLKMQAEEEKIWGSSAAPGKPGPSEVTIQTNIIKRGTVFQATHRNGGPINNVGSPSSKDGYVAFPLRDKHNPVLLENVEFEVKIRYPQQFKNDVEASLWAWETFGGIGARTRRGFGALTCIEINSTKILRKEAQKIKQTIQAGLAQYVAASTVALVGIPHLTQTLRSKVVGQNFNTEIESWRFLVHKLQDFRQRRPGRFGRSLWPEPDAIRRLTHRAATKHATPTSTVDKFPRAKFGLPIIYQFKEADENLHPGDPHATTLQGKEYDRLASPLIIRPITCEGGSVGLAVILEWKPMHPGDESYTPPGGLILKGAPGDPPVQSNITLGEARDITPLGGKTDIFQAFLDQL